MESGGGTTVRGAGRRDRPAVDRRPDPVERRIGELGGGRVPARSPWWATAMVTDGAAATLGWIAAEAAARRWGHPAPATEWLGLSALAVLVLLGSLHRSGLYGGRGSSLVDEVRRVVIGVSASGAAALLAVALGSLATGGWFVVAASGAALALVMVVRAGLRAWYGGTTTGRPQRVVIVGVGEEVHELVALIRDHPESNLSLVGVIGDQGYARRQGLEGLWLADIDDIERTLRRLGVSTAVVTATGFRGPQFRRVTQRLLAGGFDVLLSTGVNRFGAKRFGVRPLAHESLIEMADRRPVRGERRLKRALDLVVSISALVLLSPVLAVAALAVKLEDRGPVLFRQTRVGRNGEVFGVYKFRSMVVDAEARLAQLAATNQRSGPLFKLNRDPRVTRVGRWLRETSIDELPQLVNVVRGDMSLVGPRPPLPAEVLDFDEELKGRFTATPGITGLWQVEARTSPSFNAYRRLDLHYVENWSFAQDLLILLATVQLLLVAVLSVPARALGGRGVGGEGIADLDRADTSPLTAFSGDPLLPS